jgi:LPS-assembly lipoprotein
VILDFPFIADDKEVLTISGGGSVREYLLIKRVQFRLHDADGNDWLPVGEIALRRTYSFSESEVLARNTQEQRPARRDADRRRRAARATLQAAKKPA